MINRLAVISNTGPLISALQCDRVDLLQRYLRVIYVPESVIAELDRAGRTARNLLTGDFVVAVPLSATEAQLARQVAEDIARSPLSRVADPDHHLPEAEAIALMTRLSLGAERILLEEKVARQIAQAMGLPITGFIGILLMACQEQVLSPTEMRSLLETCRRQGTRYSHELVDRVCHLCQKVSGS